MKRVFLYLAMMLMGVLTFAQETITVSANSDDISQNLDLKVVAKLFAEASTTEEFEIMLNNPDSAYSNLDLNGDNQIDYLRVVETGSGKSRLIVIQAVLAKDIYQDVASIYVEKDEQEQVSIQIIGDEYVYGTNYIIEPVYIYRPMIYNWLWDIRWYCWYSPYYWGYYPHWWYYHSCYTYHWYWDRCHRFHHYHHHCSFHHGHQPNHGYHTMHSSVTRRDYAITHPTNSFSVRNIGYRNASDLKRTGISYRSGSVRQPNFNNSRTYGSKNTINRTGSSVRTVNSNNSTSRQVNNQAKSIKTDNNTNRRTSRQSGTTRTYQNNKGNSFNRTSNSSYQRMSNAQTKSSSSSTFNRSGNTRSSSSVRSSSSSGSMRSSSSVSRSSSKSSIRR